MAIGDRIKERLRVLGMSEAELARRVGIRQSSINALVRGETQSSRHLHAIARELRTTAAYLLGETDDPEDGAPVPPAPSPQVVVMPVLLPSEAALARMFEGLLRPLDRQMPVGELAQILAQRLPIGLGQLRDLVPEHAQGAWHASGEALPVPAKGGRASQPKPRT